MTKTFQERLQLVSYHFLLAEAMYASGLVMKGGMLKSDDGDVERPEN